MDVVDKRTRSKMMSGIRSKNTKPEKIIRSILHTNGFRYRLNVAALPAKPDIVLRKHRAVVLVNGCFWHGHGCHLFKWPKSRPEFWKEKISRNIERDKRNLSALEAHGWRIAIIWECSLKGKSRLEGDDLTEELLSWLCGTADHLEIKGKF